MLQILKCILGNVMVIIFAMIVRIKRMIIEIFTLLFNYVNNGEILKAEELKFITEPQYYILIKMRWVLISKFHKMIG